MLNTTRTTGVTRGSDPTKWTRWTITLGDAGLELTEFFGDITANARREHMTAPIFVSPIINSAGHAQLVALFKHLEDAHDRAEHPERYIMCDDCECPEMHCQCPEAFIPVEFS